MKIVVACDHAGFPLKGKVIEIIRAAGHEPLDLGTQSIEPVDYPDFAQAVGQSIQLKQAERGVLLCGSGVGASIAANKLRGVRAGVCHDTYSAHQAVEHDDMNVLCIGARIIGPELAREILLTYLGAKYSNEERHARRLSKIIVLENRS